MPGLDCSKVHYYKTTKNIDDLFGFYYCRIKTPSSGYLGLLPVRDKDGINFPLGH